MKTPMIGSIYAFTNSDGKTTIIKVIRITDENIYIDKLLSGDIWYGSELRMGYKDFSFYKRIS